jgi:hypothetical protein
MKIVDTFVDNLFTFWYEGSAKDELALQFSNWKDPEYLYKFFKINNKDLRQIIWRYISIEYAIDKTIQDALAFESELLDNPDIFLKERFKPLDDLQTSPLNLNKSKCYGIETPSWLRLYGLRVEKGVYVITGGAIKLTHRMEERTHTNEELIKLEKGRNFLLKENVFDSDGLVDLIEFQL